MADITESDLEKLRKKNDELRTQIADEQQALVEAQSQRTRENEKALLEQEQERLKKQLEEAKAATKGLQKLNTPLEQAEAAADPAANVPASGNGQE